MLLNVYFTTTVISCVTVFVVNRQYKRRLNKKGYVFVNENKSLMDVITNSLVFMLNCLIPIRNIMFAVAFVIEKNSKQMENELLKNGVIVLKGDKLEKVNIDEEKEVTEVVSDGLNNNIESKICRELEFNDERVYDLMDMVNDCDVRKRVRKKK